MNKNTMSNVNWLVVTATSFSPKQKKKKCNFLLSPIGCFFHLCIYLLTILIKVIQMYGVNILTFSLLSEKKLKLVFPKHCCSIFAHCILNSSYIKTFVMDHREPGG